MLGQLILETRTRKGLTQKAAAIELGCSHNNYRMWELGAQLPEAGRLKRLREWLGIDAQELLDLLAEESGRRSRYTGDATGA